MLRAASMLRGVVGGASGALLLLAACSGASPRAVVQGDACGYCRMGIEDPRFAAQVIASTGKERLFDSIECAANYLRAAADGASPTVYVGDAEVPGAWIAADQAGFLVDATLRPPMGRVTAFASPDHAAAARIRYGGTVVSWRAVLSDSAGIATHEAARDEAPDAEIRVGDGARFGTVAAAVAAAKPGSVIRIAPGHYREPTIEVLTPGITILGEGWPVLDGEGARELMVIRAEGVTVRGIEFMDTGVSHMTDRAALRAIDAHRCTITGNRFTASLFAIYLQRSRECVVEANEIQGAERGESTNGNGIHLWYSPGARILDNHVRGQRDGIYLEFSRGALAAGNVSEGNARYGLHFMFSDSCTYDRNTFRANGAGVAVMYSRGITLTGNGFLDARGSAAYGLLLKEITDGRVEGNRFVANSTGLHLEGASRLAIQANEFRNNGWAVRLLADAEEDEFAANRFLGNAFDVATNSRTLRATFAGNYWDAYEGYDLDRDGRGDVPFHPVRLYSLVVEKHPESLVLLRSPVISVLDAAERVLPVLTPELADAHPLMRPRR